MSLSSLTFSILHVYIVIYCNHVFVLDDQAQEEYHEMHLLPEPLFTLQTDNVYMSGITGTMNGRIFLCGRDGCVYEMDYQVMTQHFMIEKAFYFLQTGDFEFIES